MRSLPLFVTLYLVVAIFGASAQDEREQRVLIWGRNVDGLHERQRSRLREVRRYAALPLLSAIVRPRDLGALRSDPDVEIIEEDERYFTDLLPAVPVAGIPPVWEAGFTGRTATVGAIDTGVQSAHPMFAGVNIVSRVFLKTGAGDSCFADDASSTEDLQGHGTRTAAILAGQALPEYPGYYGAARGIGTLYVFKAGFRGRSGDPACNSRDGTLYGSDIFEALEYAATQTPVRIINLSIGAPSERDDDLLARVCDYFSDVFGMTLVFSAGNSGTDAPLNTPGIAYNGITVANLDDRGTESKSDDVIHPASTRGPTQGLRSKPDIAAPGTRVYAADIASNGMSVATGTSAAAPIVSGTAALLQDAGVTDPLALKAVLLNSSDGGGWRRDAGFGVINAEAALGQRLQFTTGVVGPLGSRYFRGNVAGPVRSMLVWNRHIDTSSSNAPSALNPLFFRLYRASDGLLLNQSGDGARDNALQLDIPAAGDYVAQVHAPAASDAFAVAWNKAGMQPVSGPALQMQCAHPNPVAANTDVAVTCTAMNTGGLPLFQVTGSLPAPVGFSTGGAQSYGNLAPGASRTASWVLRTPAVSGSFDFTGSAIAKSFGETIQADAVTTRMDVADGTVSLDPSTVFLTPESRAATIRVTGAANVASVSVPWLQASLSNGSVAVSLHSSAANLVPGTYTGSVIVGSATGVVRLTVTQPAPAAILIANARVTVDGVAARPGCPVPQAWTSVADSAPVQFWFEADNVRPTDALLVHWFPEIGLAESVQLPKAHTEGPNCYSAGLNLARPGSWRAELWINGTRRTTVNFTIHPALRLAALPACPASDPQMLRACLAFAAEPASGQTIRMEFVRPNGEVDGSRDVQWPLHGPVEYEPAVPAAGEWTVRVSSGGAEAGSLRTFVRGGPGLVLIREYPVFQFFADGTAGKVDWISPDGKTTSTAFEAPGGIANLPDPSQAGLWKVRLYSDGLLIFSEDVPWLVKGTIAAATFRPLDREARFESCFENAPEGGEAAIEFSQNGEVRARAKFEPVASAGPWCFRAALPIAGSIGAQSGPSPWQARVTLNRIEAASATFEIPLARRPAARVAPLSPVPVPLALTGTASTQ